MNPKFTELFTNTKPVIGCIHLMALPGSPLYQGKMGPIYEKALQECELYHAHGVDGLIIENFGDKPFFPDALPSETIAALSAVGREIMLHTKIPVGINALRNDAKAALSIATAITAQFIRVNVHMHAYVSDQGILSGKAFDTLRLKKLLQSNVQIFADVHVKHAAPLAELSLEQACEDLCERGLVDALIVSGASTGKPLELSELKIAKKVSNVPVLVGSGTTDENIEHLFPHTDGFIIGSYFKKEGIASNTIDPSRLSTLMKAVQQLR